MMARAMPGYDKAMEFALLNAVSWLGRPDGVIAVPGVGAYWLACRVSHPEAMARMARIRKAPQPDFALVGYDLNALQDRVGALSPAAMTLVEAHWPGPLMLQWPVGECLRGKLPGIPDELGLMQPEAGLLRDLLALIPEGVLLISEARRGEQGETRTAMAVYNTFGEDVDEVLTDDAAVGDPTPATLVGLDAGGVMRVLRSGRIVLD